MAAAETTRIVLACRRSPQETDEQFITRRDECIGLCEAAGAAVVAVFQQTRSSIDGAWYLGSGKISEMARYIEEHEVELAVFDGELSPGQVRNLEHHLGCRVLDRTQLILDIFALRAKSREGRLQVEIAQLQYLLPRLTGRGAEMSRLGGGIGTRGPGETKLEMDRRRIRQRIQHLRQALAHVRAHRETARRQRAKSVPVVALVGYTNAGKSTVMRRWLTDCGGTSVEAGNDRLFDTLDPLARRVQVGSTGQAVLLDTVGFVQNLPHLLVESFRATLEEVLAADLVVHVVDGTAATLQRMETTYQVLSEIGALDKPIITLFNKMDAVGETPPPDTRAMASLYGSATTGEGMQALYDAVARHLGMESVQVTVRGNAHAVLSGWLHPYGRVTNVHIGGDATVEATVVMERRRIVELMAATETMTGVEIDAVIRTPEGVVADDGGREERLRDW